MTPTRALIEAAERAKTLLRGLTISEVMERGIEAINAAGLSPYCVNEGRATGQERISTDWLEAAISSAKAAEEGVETTYVVEFQYMGNWSLLSTDKDAVSAGISLKRWIHIMPDSPLRIVRRDTYTTVIEVREKEGL